MAFRVFRLFMPSSAGSLRVGIRVQTGSIHTGPPRKLQYGWWAYVLGERTTPRFKDNSKIITVDGNLASGKGVFAQKLADKLGMLYLPEPDVHYWDKKMGDKELLDTCFNGNCSLDMFYKDPKSADGNSYRLQYWMYHIRFLQYSDAIEHLLTTALVGQGVVLERSPYSDMVFLESMFKQGYIRKQCVEHYNEIKGISICEFLPPHLVIYIDVSPEEVQKKLKQSGKQYLQNVPLEYLKNIDVAYKKTFLPQISETSEVLVYDTTQVQDIEKVVEDIEYLKFEKGPWLEQDDVTFHYLRMLVEDKQKVADLTIIPRYLPEVTIGGHEYDEIYYAYRSLPGKKYAAGYNEDAGDKHIWLK
uniref:NADH dehydrogenase [ubiquinone] 1 alpha subcomplex subunit 10, mitochondrial n=1 Tax=Lepisosteus oculatus TaxID=7918 RepID=W5MVC5_LEPOC